jgi:hypothetical protein
MLLAVGTLKERGMFIEKGALNELQLSYSC